MRRWAVVLLVVAAGLLAAAAPAQALTREQANAIAIKILDPARSPFANVVLYGLPTPLPGATKISDYLGADGPVEIFRPRQVVWYFWEDLNHGAEFPHESRVLLLNATTGAQVYDQEIGWEPLIDLNSPAFLATPGADTNRGYVIYSSQPLTIGPAAVAPTGTSSLPSGFMLDDCLVTIGDQGSHAGADFRGEFVDFEQWAAHVGMRSFPMPPNSTGTDLVQRVHELTTMPNNPCHNILIVLAGHGSAPPGLDPTVGSSTDPTVVSGTDFTADATDPKVVDVTSTLVTGPDLEKLLRDNPQTGFELVVDSCFSGRFVNYLSYWEKAHKLNNLQLVATSANQFQPSYDHVPAGYPALPGNKGSLLLKKYEEFRGKVIVNPEPPRQTPPEGDYVHALVDWLYEWSDNFTQTHPVDFAAISTFIPALQRAAITAQGTDFVAAKLHWTNPTTYVAADPFVVDYHYHVHISVSGATLSSKTSHNLGGPLKVSSSWDLDAPNVKISVNYTNRSAQNQSITEAIPVAISGTASETYTQSDSTGQPVACSWKLDNKVTSSFYLDMVGNDSSAEATTPVFYNPGGGGYFQNTRQLAVGIQSLGGQYQAVVESCTGSPTTRSYRTAAQVFLGTDDCKGHSVFTIPVWDLGKTEIKLTRPFRPSYCSGSAMVGGSPSPTGSTANFSGTYNVTLTRLP